MSDLRELTYLDLSDNQIYNIYSLGKLYKLEYLNLVGNNVDDFSPVIGFDNVQYFDFTEDDLGIPSEYDYWFFHKHTTEIESTYEIIQETIETTASTTEAAAENVSDVLTGKYEYYSGSFYYTLEFKSNGMCIMTDDTHRYTHSRSGTYDYADGEFFINFKMDDLYLPETLSAVVQGNSLLVTHIAGSGTNVNGEFTKIAGSDSAEQMQEMPATFSGEYEFYTSLNHYIFEFKSNGLCIESIGEIGMKYKHKRSGSYEYVDGEYIMSFPFDDKYLPTTCSAVFSGDSLIIEEIAGFGALHGDGKCEFTKVG